MNKSNMGTSPMEYLSHPEGMPSRPFLLHVRRGRVTAKPSLLVNPLLQKQRALPLLLLHQCICIAIWLEQAPLQDLCRCIMHHVPLVEAAALTERAHCVWESMVNIMEEHLIPAVTAPQDIRHDCVQDGPTAVGIGCQEVVPRVGMREARNE